jgi:integrase/recombinase XerD
LPLPKEQFKRTRIRLVSRIPTEREVIDLIETLFTWQRLRAKQQSEPLLQEREQYVSHLLKQGISALRVKNTATMLLHVIRLLKLDHPRMVTIDEIRQASLIWAADIDSHITRGPGPSSKATFAFVALKWLRFLKFLNLPPVPTDPIDVLVNEYVEFMKQAGLYAITIRTYSARVSIFLRWTFTRRDELATVSLHDVDDFLQIKRNEGYSPRTITSYCSALRSFFGYADIRRINTFKIAQGIRSPRMSRYSPSRKSMAWKDVRRLLSTEHSLAPSDFRATAILFLCSIYGLRSSEVVNLKLDDFDWISETFIVRRAKHGRIQQYPIQVEVGDAIIRYLKQGRPRTSCRNLFLSLTPPFRPVRPSTLWTVFENRIKRLGLQLKPFGAHALRRACATELLRKGSSLQDIADFLGHRDLQSVSIYAKYDTRSLKKVAAFRLGV